MLQNDTLFLWAQYVLTLFSLDFLLPSCVYINSLPFYYSGGSGGSKSKEAAVSVGKNSFSKSGL